MVILMSIVPQLAVNSIIAGAIYALVALGFNLAYSTTKFFNLAHGVLAAAGGYVVFYLTRFWGIGIWPAAAGGVIMAGCIGYILDKVIYRPLRRRRASSMVLLIASLGAFTVIQAILAMLFTSQFQTLSRGAESQTIYEIAGAAITLTQVGIVISAVVSMLGLALFLKYTTFGKMVKAVADDAEVAEIVGIEPTMGMNLLLKGVIAAIVGGVGNVYAGVLGAFILGGVENFGIWQISGEWKDAIAFALLIIFLVFRPEGIIKK